MLQSNSLRSTCTSLHNYFKKNVLLPFFLLLFDITHTASNVPLYVAEFATKSAAKSYGRCGDIVKSIAQAMSGGRSTITTKEQGEVVDLVDNVAEEGTTALSFFQAEDDSKTGVLSFVHFSRAIEKMSQMYSNLVLTGDEMGRLFRWGNDFFLFLFLFLCRYRPPSLSILSFYSLFLFSLSILSFYSLKSYM